MKKLSAMFSGTHRLLKTSFVARLIYLPTMAILLMTIFYRLDVASLYYYILVLITVLWPPVAFIAARMQRNQKAFEINFNGFIDSIAYAVWIPLCQFDPFGTFSGITAIGLAGILSGGLRGFIIRSTGAVLGIITGILLFGFQYNSDTSLLTLIVCLTGISAISFSATTMSFLSSKEINAARRELQEQKSRYEQLSSKLSKYLSPQIYNSIFSGKKEARIGSMRKKLTIFFSDIKGFTETTDSMEAEDLTSMLNHYLNEMSSIALHHGGTIDKYIGDAIMIFFGDPETKGVREDALSCVTMAIEMRDTMKSLRAQWYTEGITRPLSIRMGINTGYCTVGNFGSENRFDYTIIGEQVNLASRLETSAGTDSILISEETYLLIHDTIQCSFAGEIRVKGISRPVKTYTVLDIRDSVKPAGNILHESHEGITLSVDLMKTDPDTAVSVLLNAVEKIKTN
ncbi:MAG TPA: adenylate/guanylate cyclase domain-containing protein [Spirochaetota bacterium]|nr:adenylate/guanylate cyclase domain-containing protein [Spirochaetota bacterium]